MSEMLKKIKDYLNGSRTPMSILPELFPPADLGYIQREVNLEASAKRDGLSNYPSEDAVALSPVELDIQGRLEGVRDHYLADYSRQISVYEERIGNYNSTIDLLTLNPRYYSAMTTLRAQQIDLLDTELYEDGQTLKALAQEARHFRKANRLENRIPAIPADQSRVWVWITIAIVAELLLNFFMLREAGSVFQVAAQSTLYGVVNILLPFVFVPSQLRYAWHVNINWKIWGCAVLYLYVIYLFLVNLLMAHYRGVVIDSSFQLQISDQVDESLLQTYWASQTIAFTNFSESWFGLSDIWSWFLFTGGVGLSCFAVYKGFTNDDPYPHYGELKRRYDQQYNHYLESVRIALAEIEDSRNSTGTEIEKLSQVLSQDFQRIPRLATSIENMKERCQYAMERLNRDYSMLIQEYRRINLASRSQPAPQYFSELPQIELVPLGSPLKEDVKDPAQAIDKLRQWLSELDDLHNEHNNKIEATREMMKDGYPFEVKLQ